MKNEAYDHYSAIHALLTEKLRSQLRSDRRQRSGSDDSRPALRQARDSSSSSSSTSYNVSTSIDEGVESDLERDSDSSALKSGIKLPRSDVFVDLSQLPSLETSNQSISTGVSSAFNSFDSNMETELVTSSPTSAEEVVLLHPGQATTTMTPPIVTKFKHRGQHPLQQYAPYAVAGALPECGNPSSDDERHQSQSPISFREGRRASDGLMAQQAVAFRQRLKENMKARGLAEIHKEMTDLQQLYHPKVPANELQLRQHQHYTYQQQGGEPRVGELRQRSLEENPSGMELPKLQAKRSLPATPTPGDQRWVALRAVGGGGGAMSGAEAAQQYYNTKTLQQKLLHHRLQQKRQAFQRHHLVQQLQQLQLGAGRGRSSPRSSQEESSEESDLNESVGSEGAVAAGIKIDPLAGAADIAQSMPLDLQMALQQQPLSRRLIARQSSYKMAQQQQQTAMLAGPAPDLLLWQSLQTSEGPPPLSPMVEENCEDVESSGNGQFPFMET